jgi:peptidoglycan/xylan/chitin deacetylase (PgdA/CDA1 family)
MRQLPILMYHWLRPAGCVSQSRSPQLEITPERFDRQLTLLRGAGYETVSLARALGLEGGGERLPRRPIVLTFDDGTADFWEHARPALARHGLVATLFVVSGHVGGRSVWDRALGEPDRPLLDWEQLARLRQEGFEIGSHTHGHRPLIGLPDAEAREELARSRREIGERLGAAPRFVAYPRGFYTARDKALAREVGYEGACAVILYWRQLWRSDRYELKRMTIKGGEPLLAFRLRLRLSRLVTYTGEGSRA